MPSSLALKVITLNVVYILFQIYLAVTMTMATFLPNTVKEIIRVDSDIAIMISTSVCKLIYVLILCELVILTYILSSPSNVKERYGNIFLFNLVIKMIYAFIMGFIAIDGTGKLLTAQQFSTSIPTVLNPTDQPMLEFNTITVVMVIVYYILFISMIMSGIANFIHTDKFMRQVRIKKSYDVELVSSTMPVASAVSGFDNDAMTVIKDDEIDTTLLTSGKTDAASTKGFDDSKKVNLNVVIEHHNKNLK